MHVLSTHYIGLLSLVQKVYAITSKLCLQTGQTSIALANVLMDPIKITGGGGGGGGCFVL